MLTFRDITTVTVVKKPGFWNSKGQHRCKQGLHSMPLAKNYEISYGHAMDERAGASGKISFRASKPDF
jgi:hypothetical protein